MADAFKDEEDPQIAFYGYPPKGKWRNGKQRIEPFSMKLGNNLIPLQGTSLAIIPAIVGGMIESRKSGSDEKSVLMAGAVSSLGAVATMSFIKPKEICSMLLQEVGSINQRSRGTYFWSSSH